MSGPIRECDGEALCVRPAIQEDLDQLASLELECFARDPWQRESLRKALVESGYLSLVALSGTRAVAYLVGWHVGQEADLARIGVHSAVRRQGLAEKLLQEALALWEAKGVEQVFLDVRASNEAALGLYCKLGFEVVGLRPGYYADGEDAILLRRDL